MFYPLINHRLRETVARLCSWAVFSVELSLPLSAQSTKKYTFSLNLAGASSQIEAFLSLFKKFFIIKKFAGENVTMGD